MEEQQQQQQPCIHPVVLNCIACRRLQSHRMGRHRLYVEGYYDGVTSARMYRCSLQYLVNFLENHHCHEEVMIMELKLCLIVEAKAEYTHRRPFRSTLDCLCTSLAAIGCFTILTSLIKNEGRRLLSPLILLLSYDSLDVNLLSFHWSRAYWSCRQPSCLRP